MLVQSNVHREGEKEIRYSTKRVLLYKRVKRRHQPALKLPWTHKVFRLCHSAWMGFRSCILEDGVTRTSHDDRLGRAWKHIHSCNAEVVQHKGSTSLSQSRCLRHKCRRRWSQSLWMAPGLDLHRFPNEDVGWCYSSNQWLQREVRRVSTLSSPTLISWGKANRPSGIQSGCGKIGAAIGSGVGR